MIHRIFLYFTVLFICSSAFSQTLPSVEWQKCFGGSQADLGFSIQQTNDGGYIVGGVTQSNDGDVSGHIGYTDCLVLKLDSKGIITWQKTFGSLYDDQLKCIQQTKDGGYIFAGFSNVLSGSSNNSLYDFYVVKLNGLGNVVWEKLLGGSNSDLAYSIQQTSDGGYIVAGESSSVNGNVTGGHGASDMWIVKLSETGNLMWQKSIGGSQRDVAWCIKQTKDGGYIISGTSSSINGDVIGGWPYPISWFVKLDATGTITWQKQYGSRSLSQEDGLSISQTTDGGYISTGYCVKNSGDVTGNHGNTDVWLLKLDNLGNLTWQKSLGGSKRDFGACVNETYDGGFIISGSTFSNDGDAAGNSLTTESLWLIKTSSLGNLEWQKSFGILNYGAVGYSAQQTRDGGFIVVGLNGINEVCHGGFDIGVIKLKGNLANTAISHFLFPNPTVDQLTVSFLSNMGGIKSVLVFDQIGRKVFSKNVLVQIGINSIKLNTSHLASGEYFLSIAGTNYLGKFIKITN